MNSLRQQLIGLDGRGYKAYRGIEGIHAFPGFSLHIDHVQGDPFADPSRMRVQLTPAWADLPSALLSSPTRRRAVADFLTRSLGRVLRQRPGGRPGTPARNTPGERGGGSGNGGEVRIAPCGQQVLTRSALLVTPDGGVEARIQVGLPAAGRRILGRQAASLLTEELPRLVEQGLRHPNLDGAALQRQVHSVEDQVALRQWLAKAGLVAFIADGAILPRRSGVDDRPLADGAIPLCAPDALAREVTLPHAGRVRGLAIPRGITLIVGGGFHGKSTLLHALERGVHDHLPDDGRQQVASDPGAMKIRAEDGRAIHGVDISPFINNLPLGRDTRRFSTANASGSTSQAANVVEAIDAGSRLLLLDEDTAATNFMIRDATMQALVAPEQEPITPLSHRIRQLHRERGVSVVLVMGGSSEYFACADTVIQMRDYQPLDVTARARALAQPVTEHRLPEGFLQGQPRIPRMASLSPGEGPRPAKIRARERERLAYGQREIDLGRVEQLLERGQTIAIGLLLQRFAQRGDATPGLTEGMRRLYQQVEEEGLDTLSHSPRGDLALPRFLEAMAALNRLRGVVLEEEARER